MAVCAECTTLWNPMSHRHHTTSNHSTNANLMDRIHRGRHFLPKWDLPSPHWAGPPRQDRCLPIVPLTRIKHAQDFLDSFLLQGHDWFSSWLSVTDLIPVLVRLELLPFVDIGGTLQIKARLDQPPLSSNQTGRGGKQQSTVMELCITHSKPPTYLDGRIQCEDNEEIKLTSHEPLGVRYFPYPRPGAWFLSFYTYCLNGSVNIDTLQSGQAESCEAERVMVDLRIHLQPCVFEGAPCGNMGFCQENHFRQFYFSSCHCLAGEWFNSYLVNKHKCKVCDTGLCPGWRGWGCTDESHAPSFIFLLMCTLLLTLSNLFFGPAVFLALRRRYYTEALVYTVTMIFSIVSATFFHTELCGQLYHACDSGGYCGGLKLELVQYCDFYCGIVAGWVTLVALAGLPPRGASLCHLAGALAIAVGVEYQRTGLLVFVGPVVAGLALTLLSWSYKFYSSRKRGNLLNTVNLSRCWRGLVPGAGLAISGLALFALVETEANYKYVHSVWHIMISLSIIFLLPPLPPTTPPDSTNMASELLDIGEYRLNSDLTSLISTPPPTEVVR
ncbi:TMEM8A [Cordylochernes scorpioides]|uniref:TMEM8A n=1 Tax=Cordylochernes scorpioides TaxID=51811 RepID=A0ABY6K0U8_9ARAC|nr:TMEM8A [Cordylochernes scorpioides]